MPPTIAPPGPRARPTAAARGRLRRTAALLATVAAAGAVLAGCTPTIGVKVAPHAAEPVCAEVVLALPKDLGGLPQLRTSAQATAAWGRPGAAVTLRCGVPELGPTPDECTTVTSPDGTSVDWVLAEEPASGTGDADADWTFTTYGRTPAVEVHVPGVVREERSINFLDELGPAVARTERVRGCL